jgi:hypothetical protein
VREAARLISLRGALWRDIRHADGEEELYAGRPILPGLQRLLLGISFSSSDFLELHGPG